MDEDRKVDWEKVDRLSEFYDKVEKEYQRLSKENYPTNTSEQDLVLCFLMAQNSSTCISKEIPFSPQDTVVKEMSFRYGRADIVIFHIDGSASVIEAKVGAKGYNHVVSGIGQASLYATQLDKGGRILTSIRRCLLFSSTEDKECDKNIISACLESGTIPIQRASLKKTAWYHEAFRLAGMDENE